MAFRVKQYKKFFVVEEHEDM